MKLNIKMKFNIRHYIILAVMLILCIGLIVANTICGQNSQAITNLLCGSGLRFEGEDVEIASAAGDALVQNVCDDGIVLLKNEGGTNGKGILPLEATNRKLNLFGWSSTDNGFILTGSGSAYAPIQESKRFTLRAGLEDQGFEVNKSLLSKYEEYSSHRHEDGTDYPFPLVEPGRSWYTQAMIDEAKAFSDTALISFVRKGGEGMDIQLYQKKWNNTNDSSRTYLQLSKEEEDLIDLVTENFDKVIVLINTSNPLELGFLDNDKIDAALNVGHLGQSGTKSIGRILKGEVNPSARTVDTFAYDWRSAPSFANSAVSDLQVSYTEGIYIGYKWYETAFADKVKINAYGKTFDYSTEEGYRQVVKYPFGYGLSYTDFEWDVESAVVKIDGENGGNLSGAKISNKYASIEVKVAVTNVGSIAGKEVVQLYYSVPYTPGGVEKVALTLGDFEKTTLLKPGQTETLTLSFDIYDMASFDCYDKNGNGVAAYELDAGKYTISLRDNAHEVNACENATIEFSIPETLTYKLDPDTKQVIKTRFTGDSAYGGVPIDGSTAGSPIGYVTRGNFAGTFPVKATEGRSGSNVKKANSYIYDGYEGVAAPTQGQKGDLRIWTREDGSDATADDLKGTGQQLKLNEELVLKLGQNYNAPEYEQLLNQITIAELFNLVESSGYANDEIVSIGKALNRDPDGPSGLSNFFGAIATLDNSTWTGYFSETILASTYSKALAFQFGRAVGNEGATTGVSGWYAPAANTHRTPFFGRYYEYYSEDEVLSGKMAAYTIKGAASANLYCYLKHFALSEMGVNPRKTNVWITEQALRETYLRAFEIAVKDGGANAVMSAFNHIGGTWAGGNKALLTDILRNEWGFRGTVITDWSEGEDYMLPKQGIRAGNDIWLNPNNNAKNPLGRNNATDIYLARNSAHNMIYTICNTYYRYTQYDPADGEFVVSVGIRNVDKVFPWWIPVLVAVDVVIFGVIIFETTWIFVHARKRYLKEKAETPSAETASE